ncbi:AAA family ATPase [Nitratiruptor sp. SB155-2]|uniref:AAA family ATPase n=1 Tax=Nitratiruptor sp. (strain SB155-2) TaxID=387092 RepID=UPI0001587408|nr:AAA family ATPase [Nitratiruptor sp. SB155-2]BAF70782.1 conserved hypothetical protein [Nitratiruptor sp. SB155-2]
MFLKTLVLEDFRQFKDRQILNLTTTNEKNIVLIHGENGAGKTTLLEAFSWCLYGDLALTNPNNILNEYVFFNMGEKESKIARVSLLFSDKKREYIVSRSVKVTNIDNKQYWTKNDITLEMTVNGQKISNPQDTIKKILSKELRKYFFFDGERIDRLARPESKKDIQQGIKYIMGLEVYSNAIRHLKEVKKELNKELTTIMEKESPAEISPVQKKEEILEQIDQLKTAIKNHQEFEVQKEEEKKLISQELEKHKEIENIERERQRIETDLEQANEQIQKIEKKEKSFISKNAYLAISNNLLEKIKKYLDKKREKGELPSGIREQFIHDLLEKGECICGTKLEVGDFHYEHLKKLLENTIKKNIEDNFINISGILENVIGYTDEFKKLLEELHQEKNELIKQRDSLEQQYLEIKDKLKNSDNINIKELGKRLEYVENKIKEIMETLGEKKEKLNRLYKELQEVENEIQKHQTLNEKIALAEERVEIAQNILDELEYEYEFLTREVKNKLSEKVGEVFNSIIRGDYSAEINHNFELKVYKNIDGNKIPVGTSTGENQIASLSFIGSLVYIAKKWDEENQGDIFTGAGVYPIVMDSPFGSLDPEYRDSITKNLQKLSPQIIVMLSKSQWSKEVEQNLAPYINHEYILVYHNPKYKELSNDYKTINIDGQEHPLEVDSEYEYTEIRRIK